MNFYKKTIFLFVLAVIGLHGGEDIEQKIGSMLMVGFHGTSAPKDSQICQDIARYDLAGVILFDYNPVDKSKPKNIASKEQVAKLTKELQACSPNHNLLIAVDQEGGKVQRLKSSYGFLGNFPSASAVANMSDTQTTQTYTAMAKELNSVGINYNLAPVVDLAINPNNKVIYQLNRSFGSSPLAVSQKADLFINAMHQHGVLTSLKHFPGHGSSLGDTHKGYVDVTHTWKESELEPYKILANKADSVMIAHVFHSKLDPLFPASLSKNVITNLLRNKLGYNGAVITDDLQMGAIAHKYTLAQTLQSAINAGNDILLFGNQLDSNKTVQTKLLVDTIKALLESQDIQMSDIDLAHARVQNLKAKLKNNN